MDTDIDPWYMVAYVLTGDAAHYHRSLTKKLVSRFHVPPYHEHIPPHITFVPPFLISDIDALKPLLLETVKKHKTHKVTVGGLGHFNDRAIYLDADAPGESRILADDVAEAVKQYVRPRDRHHQAWKAHVSLAHQRFLGVHFKNMLEYLETLPVETFMVKIDKLSLLMHNPHTRTWSVRAEFPLKS